MTLDRKTKAECEELSQRLMQASHDCAHGQPYAPLESFEMAGLAGALDAAIDGRGPYTCREAIAEARRLLQLYEPKKVVPFRPRRQAQSAMQQRAAPTVQRPRPKRSTAARPQTRAEYEALPKRTRYIDGHGRLRIKT
jgi:hypothetical protein